MIGVRPLPRRRGNPIITSSSALTSPALVLPRVICCSGRVARFRLARTSCAELVVRRWVQVRRRIGELLGRFQFPLCPRLSSDCKTSASCVGTSMWPKDARSSARTGVSLESAAGQCQRAGSVRRMAVISRHQGSPMSDVLARSRGSAPEASMPPSTSPIAIPVALRQAAAPGSRRRPEPGYARHRRTRLDRRQRSFSSRSIACSVIAWAQRCRRRSHSLIACQMHSIAAARRWNVANCSGSDPGRAARRVELIGPRGDAHLIGTGQIRTFFGGGLRCT